jgi:2'-hydroxyisoflavone reductase
MTCWLPADGEYAGFGSVDVSRAMKAGLGFRPLKSTIEDTLEWWSTQPENPEGPRTELRAGIAPEKEEKVLAAWHARETE